MMVRSRLLVVHEHSPAWSRQLKARLAGKPIRWRETRTAVEVETALVGSAAAIVVVDLGKRPSAGLEAIAKASGSDAAPLVLALEPNDRSLVADLAEELGSDPCFSRPNHPARSRRLDRQALAAARRTSRRRRRPRARRSTIDSTLGPFRPRARPFAVIGIHSSDRGGTS